MNLTLLILIPLLTATAVLFCKELKQIRVVSLAGAAVQLALALFLLSAYFQQREQGNTQFLFEQNTTWFAPLNINYHVGVDGISIAMILLTALVVLAGILVSWTVEKQSKTFFFLLVLLSMGAYGFFISLDLFTMFFFLEIAVVPKFLLIGVWGSGKKEYSAMKLALMLMAGSALVFVGLAGIYFHTHSFDTLQIAGMKIPLDVQKIFFPFAFIGFGIFTAICKVSKLCV
jgi:NADH-quinone oxidoreductase subunit M